MGTSQAVYRILVVDDSRTLRAAFGSYLETNGYLVSSVDSVERALPLLESFEPHAVLLDSVLPGAIGLTLAERIRKTDKLKHIKIVAMSGDDTMERLAGMVKSQYDVFLKKPFPMRQLLDTLARLLPKAETAGAEF